MLESSLQYSYYVCTNCENYSRAIIISFIRKYAANRQIQFEGEIYSRKYGGSCLLSGEEASLEAGIRFGGICPPSMYDTFDYCKIPVTE